MCINALTIECVFIRYTRKKPKIDEESRDKIAEMKANVAKLQQDIIQAKADERVAEAKADERVTVAKANEYVAEAKAKADKRVAEADKKKKSDRS